MYQLRARVVPKHPMIFPSDLPSKRLSNDIKGGRAQSRNGERKSRASLAPEGRLSTTSLGNNYYVPPPDIYRFINEYAKLSPWVICSSTAGVSVSVRTFGKSEIISTVLPSSSAALSQTPTQIPNLTSPGITRRPRCLQGRA